MILKESQKFKKAKENKIYRKTDHIQITTAVFLIIYISNLVIFIAACDLKDQI